MKIKLLQSLPGYVKGYIFDSELEFGNWHLAWPWRCYKNYTDIFEELPESQEEKDHGKCSASFCRAGGGYENCTHPDNDFEKARRNKPQKEECKGGGHKFLDGEGICICGSVARQKPQPKQKPSEWIKNRARELAISATGYVTNQADYLNVATRDFLDSHADIFNK